MKYVITGTEKSQGTIGDDSGYSYCYTELGWEVMVNRLRIIDLLYNKIISIDDTVVTCVDRFFLYNKIFKNVIDADTLISLNIPKEYIIDLTEEKDMYRYLSQMVWQPRYQHIDRDLDNLLKINIDISSQFDISKPFVCLLGRFRSWCEHRNTNVDYLNNMINFLHQRGITVFLTGKNAKEMLKNDIPIYVTLQEFCYLMSQQSCKFVYGVMSGPMHLSKFCCKSIVLINDEHGYRQEKEFMYDPLYFGVGSEITQVPIVFYSSPPNENELLKYI